MATQIEMDHTGHSRYEFDIDDTDALAKAEKALQGFDQRRVYGRSTECGR